MNNINCVNQIGSQGNVLCAYSDLLRKIWIGYKESSISPRNFKRMIANFNSVYSGYDQQDSQEFVSFLMDTLHEDLNMVLKKPYIEYKDYEGGNLDQYAKECWN